MIRQVKHNDKNYFVVHTDIHISDKEGDITVPIIIQVNVTSVEPRKQLIVYSKIKSLFDKGINTGYKPVAPVVENKWWEFWKAK